MSKGCCNNMNCMCNPLHFLRKVGQRAAGLLVASLLKNRALFGRPQPRDRPGRSGDGDKSFPIPSARLRSEWRQGFAAPRSSPGPAGFAAQAAASGRALDPPLRSNQLLQANRTRG